MCFSDGIQLWSTEVTLSKNQLPSIPYMESTPDSVERIDLWYNPIQCSTICWAKQSNTPEIELHSDDCENGMNWNTWNGLDSNGQCLIPVPP